MKTAIAGYSGSGKSTLANRLSQLYGAPVLHLDTVQFLPGWKVRSRLEQQRLADAFMDQNSSWVIDGNYFDLSFSRRMEEADTVVLLLFNRFSCFARALRRYFRFRGKTRPDMADGCREKFDAEFMWWILRQGRTGQRRRRYKEIIRSFPSKTVVIKNQRRLDEYLQSLEKRRED